MKKRNIFAKDLFSKKYHKRIVKPKKGKGSYRSHGIYRNIQMIHGRAVQMMGCWEMPPFEQNIAK